MKTRVLIFSLLVAAAIFRTWFAIDTPLNGDEVGVGLLQASGQAVEYESRLPSEIVSVTEIKNFVNYSNEFGITSVIDSLRFAGMHPPLYYFILHYSLKFFEAQAFALRIVSILFSLASVVLMYLIGKEVIDKRTGIVAAALYALSSYGVLMSSMVRPYPLVMFLALLSTLLAWRLCRDDRFNWRNYTVYLYTAIVLLGLYSMYQFVFVFLFQLSFLIIHNSRRKQVLQSLGLVAFIIGLAYLPWIPSLVDQLTLISSDTYYFHTGISFFETLKMFVFTNAIFFLTPSSVFLQPMILVLFYAIVTVGIVRLYLRRRSKIFIIAVGVYFLIYFATEALLGMSTMAISKFAFLSMPLVLIFLAAGLTQGISRKITQNIAITVFIVLFTTSALFAVIYLPRLSPSEQYLYDFAKEIKHTSSVESKELVVIDTLKRRIIFPLAYVMEEPLDVLIDDDMIFSEASLSEVDLTRYERVYVTDFGFDDSLSEALPVESIVRHLGDSHFVFEKTIRSGRGETVNLLHIYQRY